MKFSIYRLKDAGADSARNRFLGSESLTKAGAWPPKAGDYEQIYHGNWQLNPNPIRALDRIYTRLNTEPRMHGFCNHYTLSVGDIIILSGQAYFCDSIGWRVVPGFCVNQSGGEGHG